MRVADTCRDDVLIACHLVIQRLVNIVGRLLQRAVKFVGVRRAQVEIIDCIVQNFRDVLAVLVVLLHSRKCRERHPQIIVELLDQRVDFLHLDNQVKLCVQNARVRLQAKLEHIACLCRSRKQHIAVVHVNSLKDFPVHKQ